MIDSCFCKCMFLLLKESEYDLSLLLSCSFLLKFFLVKHTFGLLQVRHFIDEEAGPCVENIREP